jgi:UPF0755 protein
MNDESGTSWHDGPDRQRHHHPAIDRGHSIIRGGQPQDGGYDDRGYPARDHRSPAEDPRYGQPDPYAQDRPGGFAPNAGGGAGYGPYADDGYATGQMPPASYPRRGVPDPRGRGAADPRQPDYGYAGDGYERGGPPTGYRHNGYDHSRYAPSGYDLNGYDQNGYDQNGYDQNGYDQSGHDQSGYEKSGGRPDGYRPAPYDPRGYDPAYDQPGYRQPGYDAARPGYDAARPGYNAPGGFDQAGYDQAGYDRAGYDQAGYDQPGYDRAGYDQAGYDQAGYDQAGYGKDYPTGNVGQPAYDAGPGYPDEPSGRGARRVRSGETSGGGRQGRAAEPQPELADFYEKPEAPKRRRRSPAVLVVVVLMLIAVVFGGYFAYHKITGYFGAPDYSGNGTGTVKVKVAAGDTATDIATTLVNAGVIKGTKAFITAATNDPNSVKIEPGTYALHRKMSAAAALKALEAKDSNGNLLNALVYKVTIPEGTITPKIYAALSKATGIPLKDFVTAAKDPIALGVDKSWFVGKTHNGRPFLKSTEGFLFPATYNFQPDESAQQMLKDMVKKFNDVVGPDDMKITAASKRLGMTPYEILINASIAQAEASSAADMAGVAEVVLNRIYRTNGDAGDRLGIDSEVNYWLKLNGKESKDSAQLTVSQLHDAKDPYNTHDKSGLPPGAIDNPGRDALNAAMNPDTTKRGYYFWQTIGSNPKVVFAKTSSQFAAQQK